MARKRSTALAALAAFALCIDLGPRPAAGQGLREELRQVLRGTPPDDVPTFPERVVAVPPFNGDLELMLDRFAFLATAMLRAHVPEAKLMDEFYRHRSLPLGGKGGGGMGLSEFLIADAETKGWSVVPELTVDGVRLYQTIGFERDGWHVFVLMYGDAFLLSGRNPGISLQIERERFDCPVATDEGERAADTAGGEVPCELGGFLPVRVYGDVPADRYDWLAADAPVFPPDGHLPWSVGAELAWDELVELAR